MEADTHRLVPRCIVARVVIANSDDDQSDIQAVHTRSNLESCVDVRGYGVEEEWVLVAHPDPGMADVGQQGGNPVADHVSGMSDSGMFRVRFSELVHDRIVEQVTGIVDPETPVDCSRLWALVTWNADNPGVDPGSLLFLEADRLTYQVIEIVPVAGN